MECPHCLTSFHPEFDYIEVNTKRGESAQTLAVLYYQDCPACQKYILYITFPKEYPEHFNAMSTQYTDLSKEPGVILLYPKIKAFKKLSQDIPQSYVKEYNEAAAILETSPNASGALSRRCLQRLLRENANVKPGDLSTEIQQVLDSHTLPSLLADAIDAVRNIGNFGAHPNKSNQTGTIVDVEPGEAEWNLEVLDGLFDFYFVQPAALARKKVALNQKLKEAGKPQMK